MTIIPYEPKYQVDFKRLNVEWISAMFQIEDHDVEQLDHPEMHILPNGGQIFLACRATGDRAGDIVGTVAMVSDNAEHSSYELAKMSVSPSAQGQGVGQKLAEAALDYARQMGAASVWLESNRKAAAAIRLYHRVGFREIPLRPSPYTRADICMEIRF